jgi:thiamine biosynthesis protein ThiS
MIFARVGLLLLQGLQIHAPQSHNYSMTLTVNGAPRECSPGLTLAALVEELGMRGDRLAIELNRDIVSRARWSQTILNDGDQLEIVHFVGGGSGI